MEFIRLICSGRQLRILGAKIPMPDELVYLYLTATFHFRAKRMVVEGRDLSWRRELRFALSP